jgi:hypothetical protein
MRGRDGNIEIDLKEIRYKSVDWIDMVQDRFQQNMIISFHIMLVISVATEQLLDSQEELCSMESVTSCVENY